MLDPSCIRGITFTVPSASGGPGTSINVIEQNGDLRFTVDVLNTQNLTADLRGLFFHASDSILNDGLQIIDKDPVITQTKIGNNNVIDLGNGNNLNGVVKQGFDIGLEFGYEGIGQGKYDVHDPVSFTLHDPLHPITLDVLTHMLFGVRQTSVGAPNGSRSGSTKDIFTAPAAPDAKDDTYSIFEDGAIGLNDPRTVPLPTQFFVLANDTDADNDALSIVHIGAVAQHGTVTIAADGKSVFYTPTKDYAGKDSFIYCISDGHGGTDYATVNVNITPVADIPDLSYQILPGNAVNKTVVRVTAKQTDADSSEFIDRIFLTGIPGGVTADITSLNPITTPTQITQDFILTLPLNQDTSFNLGITAVSTELVNGDEESKSISVPIVFDYNANSYTPDFLATNQSIWSTGNQFTFTDDRFIGIDTGPLTSSSNGFIGYDFNGFLKTGFQSTLTFQGGGINANLDYNLGVNTNYNKTTDQLLISSSQLLTGGDFTTQGPQGSYNLDFIFNYALNLALTYNINLGLIGSWSGNIGDPIHFGSNNTINVINLDSSDLQTSITLPKPLDSLSLDLAWPNIATDANPTGSGTFSSSGASNNFLQLNLDPIQALADIFLDGVNPLNFSLGGSTIGVDITLLQVLLSGGLNFLQNFLLQPTGFSANLLFENGSTQPFTLGSDLLISNASQLDANHDGHVGFTLVLDPQATLSNDTELGFNIGYSLDVLKFGWHYDFVVASDSGTIGPAYHNDATLPLGSVSVYNNTFGLDFTAQNFAFAA